MPTIVMNRKTSLAQAQNVAMPSLVPPAEPTYTGLPGVVENLGILAILSASTWAGIRVGMSKSKTPVRIAGYVGGVGSAALALLYLGTKVGIVQDLGLPSVRVSPL